jgi:hypothetical protein
MRNYCSRATNPINHERNEDRRGIHETPRTHEPIRKVEWYRFSGSCAAGMSRSSADTALFTLFTLPSPLDTITIDVSLRLLQSHQSSWLHCWTGPRD